MKTGPTTVEQRISAVIKRMSELMEFSKLTADEQPIEFLTLEQKKSLENFNNELHEMLETNEMRHKALLAKGPMSASAFIQAYDTFRKGGSDYALRKVLAGQQEYLELYEKYANTFDEIAQKSKGQPLSAEPVQATTSVPITSGELSDAEKNEIIKKILRKIIPEEYLTTGASGLIIDAVWTQNNLDDMKALENALGKYNLKLNIEVKDENTITTILYSQETVFKLDDDLSEEFKNTFEREKASQTSEVTDEQDEDQGFDFDGTSNESDQGLEDPQPPLPDEETLQHQEKAKQAQSEIEQTRADPEPLTTTTSPTDTVDGSSLTKQARDLLEENKKLDENKEMDDKEKAKKKHELLKKIEGVAKPILDAKKKFAGQSGDKKQTLGEILAEETKLPAKGEIEDSIEALLNNLIAGLIALQKYYGESNKSEAEEKPLQSTTDTITGGNPDKSDKKPKELAATSEEAVVTSPKQAQEHPPEEEPTSNPKIVAKVEPMKKGVSPKMQELLENGKNIGPAIQGMTDVLSIQSTLDELKGIQLQMQQDPNFAQSSIHQPQSEGTGVDLSGLTAGLAAVKQVVAADEPLFTVKPQQIPADEQEALFTMEQGGPKQEDVVDAALSITAHPKNKEDDKVALTAKQAAELKARSKLLDEKHLDFKDPIQMLKDDEYEVYKKQYGDDFFRKLAVTIVERSDAVKDPSALNPKHKIQHRHAQRTLDIGNAVKFAEWGARRELIDAKNDTAVFSQYKETKAAYEKVNEDYRSAEQAVAKHTDQIELIKAQQEALDPASEDHNTKKAALSEALDKATKELSESQKTLDKIKPDFEAKENAFKRSDYTQALAKVEVAEKIRRTFESLHALSKYRSRYTDDNYNQRMNELKQLMQRHDLSDDNKKMVQQAVQHAQENYNFHKTKMYKPAGWRSSRFDSTKDNFSLSEKKYKKDLKIEHYTESNGSKTVQVTFSFNRENMSGENRSRFNPAGHNYAYGEMKRQVSRMLDVAIGEYNKGSPENPIHIRYGKSKSGKQLAQPDIALGIMMELKKRAIEENREFTVISPVDGKRVQITADRELNPQEMAIMRHYATEKASMHKGKGNFKESTYGGAGILRHAGLTDPKAFKESKDSTRNEDRAMAVDTALQGYLDKQIGHREAKLDKVFSKEAGKLEGKSYSEEKRKTASARAG